MTNLEYLLIALKDEIDDGGASFEAAVHYNIACPHYYGKKDLLCEDKKPCREICVECKMKWLEEEYDG